MINPKELRIGNLVYREGIIRMVKSISDDYIGLCFEYSHGVHYGTSKDLTPIPLTHEIFKQAGFELFPWGFVKNDVLIRVHWNGKAAPKYWLEVGNGLRVDLLPVHQLQNLFHALTGEELEIKL